MTGAASFAFRLPDAAYADLHVVFLELGDA